MGSLISRLVSALWTCVAALTIVVAILISVVRLMLPQLNQQRDTIENFLSEITDRPVHIGEMNASWRGWAPQIDITDLVLLARDRTTELARFDYASVDISPSRSIRQRRLVPRRLIVGGMRVALERDRNGEISIAGMPPSRWPVAEWLLQQKDFVLRDTEITFADLAIESPPIQFSNVTLSVTDGVRSQRISGSWQRNDGQKEQYAFGLELDGNLLGSEWSGDLFLSVRNGQARSLISLLGGDANPFEHGEINAQVWSRWEDAQLQRAFIELDGKHLRLPNESAGSDIDSFAGSGVAIRVRDGWSFGVDHLELQAANNTKFIATDAAIRWGSARDEQPLVAFAAHDVDLSQVDSLITDTFGIDTKTIGADISALAARGRIREISGVVEHRDDESPQRYYLAAAIDNLSTNETATLPSVSGLDFSVRANPTGGIVDATQSHGILVESSRWLVQPLEIQKVAGNISWTRTRDALALETKLLELRAETIDISTRGSATWRDQEGIELNLVAQISAGDVDRLHLLIPKEKMRPRGERWLRNAFSSGQFSASNIAIRGPLNKFPFDQGGGSFLANLVISGVDLNYSSKWPIANDLSATIAIDSKRAETTIHSGRIYTAPVDGSVIEMPDIFSRQPMVRIRGVTRVKPTEMSQFIQHSPLKKTKAVRYESLAIEGQFGMTLDMNLALYPAGEKEILGLVHFSDNRISSKEHNITLEKLTGDISFTRQDWYGEGLRAVFDGESVGVVFNGGLDDPNYDTEFRMTGTSGTKQLFKYLDRYAPLVSNWLSGGGVDTAIAGRLPWKAVLTIPEPSSGGSLAPQRLTLESSLLGLDVDLPWPFGKTQAEKKPLTIHIDTHASGERRTRVDFGDTLDIEIDQARQSDGQLSTRRAEVLFGDSSPVFGNEAGLLVRGEIQRLPIKEWAAFANSARGSTVNFGRQFPASFDVKVARLESLARTFKDLQLRGERRASNWLLEISGPQAVGSIIVPHDTSESPLQLDFERLWLDKIDPDAAHTSIDPAAIPPFSLACESLRFGTIDLGAAAVSTSRAERGLVLDSLSFSQPAFSLNGDGDWLLEGGVHQSRVNLTVHGKSLAGLLKSFDYDVANIKGGETQIAIAAIWGGMPSEFTLDKLSGNFDLKVDEGRFLDIEPGGGRLFGLLSLQTLPRRLSLDFNDLFKKGFTFDSIEGSFELDRGNAYTNSLLMNGPSARIDISGRTGLADQDYDQRVTVSPALSNTIPIASALFGPAGIGVGAVIYLGQKMFKSVPEQVDKLLSREYSITGGWEEPVIEKI